MSDDTQGESFDYLGPDVPCSLGDGNVDLSEKILTEDQKRWLGVQLLRKHATARELKARYNISCRRLNAYANRLKRGHSLHGQGGRPRCLDREAIAVLYGKAQSKTILTDDELRRLIREEYKNTLRRRRRFLDPTNSYFKRRIAKRTLIYYTTYYRENESACRDRAGNYHAYRVLITLKCC
jgi:transposase